MICSTGGVLRDFNKETIGFSFIEKLAYIVELGEIEFWGERKNPPNLSQDEFKLVINRIEDVLNLKWVQRVSQNGRHGISGEDKCFKFQCKILFGGIFEIESRLFFVKGYFFDKGNLLGVTIQSFREE